jgi:hypothetical protein
VHNLAQAIAASDFFVVFTEGRSDGSAVPAPEGGRMTLESGFCGRRDSVKRRMLVNVEEVEDEQQQNG